jgi:N-acetyl sugar amidotransferase
MHNNNLGLPTSVKFCSKCVISNQRPSSTIEFMHSKSDKKETINFNSDGICDACSFNDIKDEGIDWERREHELMKLCDMYRKPHGYDVIVPGSGGKDSAYTSHILKYKYGMNPLTVTWAPHLYTDIGWKNFTNWMHVGGLDNVLYTPNGRLHRTLTREAFINLLHPFQPFIVGQRLIGPKFAKKFGVGLVMYGENQAEYGNRIEQNSNPTMDESFFYSQEASQTLLGGKPIDYYTHQQKFSLNDFEPYLPMLSDSSQKQEVHYLGYYLKWDPQECYYYAVENTGFEANTQRTEGSYSKYSSIDDKVDPFHYFTTLIKFGIGRASYDAAQEIRNGKITREEGVDLVLKYDQEFPNRFFAEFLEYIEVEETEFHAIVDSHRSDHLWVRADEEWKLRHQIER